MWETSVHTGGAPTGGAGNGNGNGAQAGPRPAVATNRQALVPSNGARAGLPVATNGSGPASSGMWEPVDAWVSLANAALPPAPAELPAGAEAQSLYQLVEDLKLEVRRLNRVVEGLSDANRRADEELVREEIDARFKWLTEQVSERLVILGNEMVAMRQQLRQRSDIAS